ncbi:MAG: oligosaccharide repeat unit polymerase [Lachnospiraceae bacterium]|nr:oligosaccharide repeat unit polymerase [Lachnospiraceae bacterium]
MNKSGKAYSEKLNITVEQAIYWGINVCFLIPIMILVLFCSSDIDVLPLVGVGLVAISVYNCIKVKNDRLLFMLFLIMSFINISLGVTDFINGAVYVSQWQLEGLRPTEYNVHAAKSLLLTNIIFSFFLKPTGEAGLYKNKNEVRQNSLLISTVGIICLFLILSYGVYIYGFDTGTYVSVSSPIFEYSLFIVVAVWFYSREYKIINLGLIIYSVAYCLFFLLRGDRSSVFMLAALVFIMYFYQHFKLWQIVTLALMAVILGNFIGIVRSLEVFDVGEILATVFNKGLYVDTFSFSYYAAIAMSALFEYDSGNHFTIGKNYLLYQIGLGDDTYANIASYAKDSYPELYNQGGGLFSAPFYSFGGYMGVIIASVLVGFFIRKIYSGKKSRMLMYQMLIVAMSFRWYLYSPTTFIRGNLLLFTIFIIIMEIGIAILEIVGIVYGKKKKTR